MLVSELMVEDVVTVPKGATVREAVRTMLEERVGSVIVMDDSVPVGIFTKTDVLAVGHECDCPFSTIPVERGMTADLVTGTSDMTVKTAASKMSTNEVRKLPIVEDFKIIGIITATDIVGAHANLLKEASGFNVKRRNWAFDEEEEE